MVEAHPVGQYAPLLGEGQAHVSVPMHGDDEEEDGDGGGGDKGQQPMTADEQGMFQQSGNPVSDFLIYALIFYALSALCALCVCVCVCVCVHVCVCMRPCLGVYSVPHARRRGR